MFMCIAKSFTGVSVASYHSAQPRFFMYKKEYQVFARICRGPLFVCESQNTWLLLKSSRAPQDRWVLVESSVDIPVFPVSGLSAPVQVAGIEREYMGL